MKVKCTIFIVALFFSSVSIQAFPHFAKEKNKNTKEESNKNEEEFSLDELDEESEEESQNSSSALMSIIKRLKINAMFDFSFDAIIGNHDEKKPAFSSNHQYIILGINPTEKIRLSAEITNLIYWEYYLKANERLSFKLGKLPSPFSSLFFHQLYGGVIEKPMVVGPNRSLIVPRDWSEYGIECDWRIIDKSAYSLLTKIWVGNGLKGDVTDYNPGTQSINMKLNGGLDNNYDKSVGIRLENNLFNGKLKIGLSGYTSKWEEDRECDYNFLDGDRVYLANIDVDIPRHLVNVPVLKNLRLKGAFVLSKTTLTHGNVDNKCMSAKNMIKTASYGEVMYYGLTKWLDLQFRFGTYDDNTKIINSQDLINYNFAIYLHPNPYLLLVSRYYINHERVNEKKDDYLLIKAVIQL